MMKSAVALLALSALASAALLTNLPNSPPVTFDQYTGYFAVTKSRNLFYWFVESQTSPSTDPVVLWLNGGPGCSSLGGFFTENGPYRPIDNGTALELNPYSWNVNASVLYLEAPAGVGFSYDTDPNFTNDDSRTAADNYQALVEFFHTFPTFKGRDFYITGESYAGHYIPTLVDYILNQGSSAPNAGINLKGFMVGNPTTHLPIDTINGTIATYFTHALISLRTYNGLIDNCNATYILNGDQRCVDFQNKAAEEMGNINPYSIYSPVCAEAANSNAHAQSLALSKRMPLYRSIRTANGDAEYQNPCIQNFMTNYLNDPTVQAALGVKPVVWADCIGNIGYNYTCFEDSMIPLYERFLNETHLQVWVYSGDQDTVVPYLGTQTWIRSLGRQVIDQWRSYTVDGQVGGYTTVFDRMTFATVRGAGHMVPTFQPARASHLFHAFLNDQPL